jgi:hypothetical protein
MPTGQPPEDHSKCADHGNAQTVADVHRAKKVSWLAIKMETAGRTAIIHLGEGPVNGRAENAGGPAAWTKLAEDALYSGWLGATQAPMIVDTVLPRTYIESEASAIVFRQSWLLLITSTSARRCAYEH